MERMQRLPGRSKKYFGWGARRYQLWLTESNLLSREIAGYSETVRRYYYRDIQAIVTGPTGAWRTFTLLTGLLLLFLVFCAGLAAYLGSDVAFVLAFIAGAFDLALLLGNLVLGPSCKTVLYTAVAEAPLYSLGRSRSAERAIALLTPFIEAAQRDLPRSSPTAPPETSTTESPQSQPPEPATAPEPAPPANADHPEADPFR